MLPNSTYGWIRRPSLRRKEDGARCQWSGMRGISAVPTYVVMQPTTLCNLDCAYCYLPFRAAGPADAGRRWPRRYAESVNDWAPANEPVLGGLARRRAAGRRPDASSPS